MTIRRRRPEDLPSCVAVLTEVHHTDGYPEVWQPDAAGWLDPPGTIAAWVAESAGDVVGHVSLIRSPLDAPGRSHLDPPIAGTPVIGPDGETGDGTGGRTGAIVRLSRLFVAPTAQGQGLARQLMQNAVSWADQHDLDVILEVYADAPAVAVYERLGWRFLTSGTASWIGRNGHRPTVRYYAAPDRP